MKHGQERQQQQQRWSCPNQCSYDDHTIHQCSSSFDCEDHSYGSMLRPTDSSTTSTRRIRIRCDRPCHPYQRVFLSTTLVSSALLPILLLHFLMIVLPNTSLNIITKLGVDAQQQLHDLPLYQSDHVLEGIESTAANNNNNRHLSQGIKQVLRRGHENMPLVVDEKEDDEDDDEERYILDYNHMDVQHYRRKLVTIFDGPTSPQIQVQPQQETTLFSTFLSRRRSIVNTTWIVRVNSNQTIDTILSKLVPQKVLYRLNLVFQGLIVKGITRSTLNWLLRRSDVLLIEEVCTFVLLSFLFICL
jgi:hypothetical protein